MHLKIMPTTEQPITRIVCPSCKEKVKGVGILPGCEIDGLTFKCKRCNRLWVIRNEKAESKTLSAE